MEPPRLRLVRDEESVGPSLSPLTEDLTAALTPDRTAPLAAPAESISPPASSDPSERAQELAERHLAACQEALWSEDAGEAEVAESPACGPFCGCDTCIVREVLYAACPAIEAGVRAELEESLRVEIEAKVRAELQVRPPGL
jgi:hypothetical protein